MQLSIRKHAKRTHLHSVAVIRSAQHPIWWICSADAPCGLIRPTKPVHAVFRRVDKRSASTTQAEADCLFPKVASNAIVFEKTCAKSRTCTVLPSSGRRSTQYGGY